MSAVAERAVGGVTAGTDGYRLRLGDIHGEGLHAATLVRPIAERQVCGAPAGAEIVAAWFQAHHVRCRVHHDLHKIKHLIWYA